MTRSKITIADRRLLVAWEAEDLGISPSTLTNWISGKTKTWPTKIRDLVHGSVFETVQAAPTEMESIYPLVKALPSSPEKDALLLFVACRIIDGR